MRKARWNYHVQSAHHRRFRVARGQPSGVPDRPGRARRVGVALHRPGPNLSQPETRRPADSAGGLCLAAGKGFARRDGPAALAGPFRGVRIMTARPNLSGGDTAATLNQPPIRVTTWDHFRLSAVVDAFRLRGWE